MVGLFILRKKEVGNKGGRRGEFSRYDVSEGTRLWGESPRKKVREKPGYNYSSSLSRGGREIQKTTQCKSSP